LCHPVKSQSVVALPSMPQMAQQQRRNYDNPNEE